MPNKVYVQLQKLGDVLNLLPLCYADAQAGQRSAIMTCSPYHLALDGCSYVDSIQFQGQPHQLYEAVQEARKTSDNVVVTQVIGDTETVKRFAFHPAGLEHAVTDSFQKEAWKLAGRLKDWQKQLPLIFDRRSPERELALLQSLNPQKQISRQRKYVLIAANGSTSPFPYKPLLFELVKNRFKGNKKFNASLVDLGEIKTERFYDLVGLYEKAYCLIACDSAPLHLARTVPGLPVCALIQDKPSYWHGSAWRPQHIFHCRYSDFPKRAVEMLDEIEKIQTPGSAFVTGEPGSKLIHTYSAYEMNGEYEGAKQTWEREYLTGRWIATPIEPGAIGRDTKSSLKDQKRLPFLKDVIRLASMRARDDDVIVLTRDHSCFVEGLTERLTAAHPWYSHRWLGPRILNERDFHPAVDLFAFTKRWWKENRAEVPDLVLGKDHYWHRVLLEVVKAHGGKELTQAIYRDKS